MPLFYWTLLLSPISSQRDMSQQMLCAFDANSTGITARWIIYLPKISSHLKGSKVTLNYVFRDLMLTTPRKSDGSKSLTWIYEKTVKWNKLWTSLWNNISVQMHWQAGIRFVLLTSDGISLVCANLGNNLAEFQIKIACILHSKVEVSIGKR